MKTKLLFVFAFFVFQCSFAKELFTDPVAPGFSPLEYCDPNNDGFGEFDLDMLTPGIIYWQSGSASDYVVTYHETQNDAEAGVNPIASPYFNITPWNQTVKFRIRNINTNAYAVGDVVLKVKPIPEATTPTNISLCDDNNDGIAVFDFTPLIPQILGTINPATVTVSFYTSMAQAEAGISPIVSISSYAGTNGQTIYARVSTILNVVETTSCYDIVSFQLHINPLPQLNTPSAPYAVCDANQDGHAAFDLTALIPNIQVSVLDTLTFHTTVTDAQTGGNPLPSTYFNINPFSQVIYARALNIVTGCYSVVQVELQVNPSPIVPILSSMSVCDADSNNQNGVTVFDLTIQTPDALAQQALPASNYNVTFYNTQAGAELGGGQIISATNYTGTSGETIWCRIENNTTHCYAVGSFNLIVNIPLALVTPTPLSVCDSDANPNDQYTTFDLTVKNNEITQGVAGFTFTYYPSLLNAQAATNPILNPSSYINVNPAIQTIGVSVTSPAGCVSLTTLDIRVLPIPAPNTNPPALAPQCDENNPGDLMEHFDLTVNAAYIVNGDPNLTLHFFHTMMDAVSNQNEIPTPTYALVGSNVWIRVENNRVDFQGNNCYVLVEQPLTVYPMPNPIISSTNNRNAICVDYSNDMVVSPLTLNSNMANPSAYSFEWYESENPNIIIGTSPTYTVDTAAMNGATRSYSVKVTGNTALGCHTISAPFDVIQSGQAAVPPNTNGYVVTNLSGVQSITVGINGYGTYEYSLDAGPRQTSNVFENVSLGIHTITVWDTEGGLNYSCSPLIINEVAIAESQVPAPTGSNSQTFEPGATLANILVSGANIQWYASAANKNNLSMTATPLPSNTILVNGTTYYATQTVDGIESTAYLPVTVHLTLGIGDNEILPIQYAPNPVKHSLSLQSTKVLKSVVVYTMLGQKVFEQNFDTTDLTIDLSNLSAGNYILKAQGETGQKTIRIIKE